MSGVLRRRESLIVFIILVATLHALAARAEVTLRGTTATPVDQVGARARVRGTLGEAVVGVARGGATEIRSGFSRPVLDTNGPAWTLGAFPNPYLEEFIDLVLVADEPLAEESISVEIDGASVAPERLAGAAYAWWVDNALSGPVATVLFRACGTDRSGNVGCFESALAARIVTAHAGGELVAADGHARIVIEPGALDRDAWVLAAALEGGALQLLVPTDLPVLLEFDARRGLPGIADPSRLRWSGSDGPIESWHDGASGRLSARASGAGIYRIDIGTPGSSRRVDAPRRIALAAAPSPFTTATTIRFDLAVPAEVRLEVLDVAGRLVARVVDSEELTAGPHTRTWEGTTLSGSAAPAGIYFLRMTTTDCDLVTKVVRLR
jgi:hypothetical protein